MGVVDGPNGLYRQHVGAAGMALGAVLAGGAADRFGRRAFVATLVLYSVATGLCGIAWNYESLLCFRFLVGFGLGGQLPVAVTLVSEFARRLWQDDCSAGKLLGLRLADCRLGKGYLVIPYYGWYVAFKLGAIPALYVFDLALGAGIGTLFDGTGTLGGSPRDCKRYGAAQWPGGLVKQRWSNSLQ